MFDPEIIAIVSQQTSAIAAELEGRAVTASDPPDLLYYASDASALADLVTHRALRAPYSTDPQLGDLLSYGFDLLRDFTRRRIVDVGNDPQRRQFAEAVLKNLDPRSAVFAGFYVRFAEVAYPPPPPNGQHPGYAIGFECRHMGLSSGAATPASMSIGKAIYSLEEQSRILSMLYGTYETCYVGAIHRFGAHNAPSCLGPCWGMLYESLSVPLALFRSPALSAEREWLATALDLRPHAERGNDNIHVAVRDNTFIPYVRVTMPARRGTTEPGLPVREIVLPEASPRPHAQCLRAFLNLNSLSTVAVRAGDGGPQSVSPANVVPHR
jgi:hypothetical protein